MNLDTIVATNFLKRAEPFRFLSLDKYGVQYRGALSCFSIGCSNITSEYGIDHTLKGCSQSPCREHTHADRCRHRLIDGVTNQLTHLGFLC